MRSFSLTAGERGQIPLWLVFLIGTLVCLVFLFYILKAFFSAEMFLGLKETGCQASVAARRALPTMPLACSTERVSVEKKDYEKAMTLEDKTVEEGGIRYVFDMMRRCKFLVGGEDALALFRDKKCYICYTLEMKDVPDITKEQMVGFALEKTTEHDVPYAVSLQSPGNSDHYHSFVITDNVLRQTNYAVVYIDREKPSEFVMWGKPLAGCVIGGKIGTKVGAIKGGLVGCAGGAAAGGVSSFIDLLAEETNTVLLTPLQRLVEGSTFACSGYAY